MNFILKLFMSVVLLSLKHLVWFMLLHSSGRKGKRLHAVDACGSFQAKSPNGPMGTISDFNEILTTYQHSYNLTLLKISAS